MKIFESKKHHEATRSLATKIGLLLNTAAVFKTLPVLLREKINVQFSLILVIFEPLAATIVGESNFFFRDSLLAKQYGATR